MDLNILSKIIEFKPETKINDKYKDILKFLVKSVNADAGVLFFRLNENDYFVSHPPKIVKLVSKKKNFLINFIKRKKICFLSPKRIQRMFKSHSAEELIIIPLENVFGCLAFFINKKLKNEISKFGKYAKFVEKYIITVHQISRIVEMNKEFGKLIEIATILTSTLHLDTLLGRIISEARKAMNIEGCSLMLLDKKTGELVFKTIKGKKSDIIKEYRIPPGKGIAGWIIKTGKPVIVNDVAKDPRFYRESDLKSGFKTRNLIGVPLKIKNEVIGVIEGVNKKYKLNFDKKDLDFFTALANQASIAIQNAQYYEQLRKMFLSTIRALAAAIDAKDPYTHGHSERVTKYSVMMAKRLRLPVQLIENIQIAGFLHDIGKIGIQENILRKPGKLTEKEYNEIKRHPIIGENILSQIETLKDVLPAIKHHHERWDGKGYPQGLRKDDIPLFSRIIALADTYDAITSDRPYRKGASSQYALKEIKRCSGSQFDPKLVDIFIKTIKNRRYYEKKTGGTL